MKVYTVIWACGSADDDDLVHTNAGVHGVYTSKESAKIGLEECKQHILDEVKNSVDPDDEEPELMEEINLEVYGSVDEEYFEISYTLGLEQVVEHTKICEVELTE